MIRLSQASRELKVGIPTIREALSAKGFEVDSNPNTKITEAQFEMLAGFFGVPLEDLKVGGNLHISKKFETNATSNNDDVVVIDIPMVETKPLPVVEAKPIKEEAESFKGGLKGLTVLGKIDLENGKKKEEVIKTSEPKNEVKKEIVRENTNIKQNKTAKIEEPLPIKTIEKKEVQEVEPIIDIPKAEILETKTQEVQLEKVIETKIVETPKEQITSKVTNEVVAEEKPVIETPVAVLPIIEKVEDVVIEKVVEESKVEKPKEEVKYSEKETEKKPFQQPKQDKYLQNNQFQKNQQPKIKEEQKITPKAEIEIKTEPIEKIVPEEPQLIEAKAATLKGLTVLGKIELPSERNKKLNKPVASSDDSRQGKRKRKKKKPETNNQTNQVQANKTPLQNNVQGQNNNIKPQNNTNQTQNRNQGNNQNQGNNNNQQRNIQQNRPQNFNNNSNNTTNNNNNSTNNSSNNNNVNRNNNSSNNNTNNNRPFNKPLPQNNAQNKKPAEVTDKQIQDQIKATLAKLNNKESKGTRRPKVKDRRNLEQEETTIKTLKVTEFISANDLASLMDVSVNEVIKACLSLGMFVSINQRLDAEAITFIASEFGFETEFISVIEESKVIEEEEEEFAEDLQPRAPIVTIMGHVDHGKTSLLDYIRKSNVASGESGGITQHIGAYDVITSTGKRIAFLDTPGHEAFTAMRARGAKVTDVVILVVAADDNVMPQTKEAINHAKVAGVPIVIAINKVDKPSARPEKIREELSANNVLVESWGGTYQDQEISAKTGLGIEELLEKVLLEAELLDLKANARKRAVGTVIEAMLDKGKGYVATVLVQAGTLKVGDVILAGSHFGKVKAMNDHRGSRMKTAGPSTPVQVLGLNGAPQAGDVIKVMANERDARDIALKREQILREQNIRATKGLTLEEIGRRRALGNFSQLKIIVKGDVDGSVEALTDSLLKLSTPEIETNVIHKGVGQITEADIMLASASEAIIVGFQVRPSPNAKKAADQEKVQIKLYSIIYNAIEEIKDAMEGMLAPKVEEIITGNIEIRDVFKISRIGTVAGCYVLDGFIKRNNKIRIIRDGIVVYEGEIGALKRFKDDVQEVKFGYECGLSIRNFNDLRVGDVIESYEEKEVKRTL